MPAGRPKEFDPTELAIQLLEYMEVNDDPMIQEFCLQRKVSKDTIYRLAKESPRLSDSIKLINLKQEVRTIRNAENNTGNSTFAIFKLKQKCYGWTDKQELEHSGEIKMPGIIIGK